MICHIFVNGPASALPASPLPGGGKSIVIAVDGGARHCRGLNLAPDYLIGDLDSIDPGLAAYYRDHHVVIDQHPSRKNSTDLELALDLAIARGAGEIEIYCALGGRWDMSFANLFLAAAAKYQPRQIRLHGEGAVCHILRPGQCNRISGAPGTLFSLLPLSAMVSAVTLTGGEYPLAGQTIPFGSTLGVSNIMENNEIAITFRDGLLVAIVENAELRHTPGHGRHPA